MEFITSWIERKLGLKVNASKSKITRPHNLKYLGFGFWKNGRANQWKATPHQESIKRFKEKVKAISQRKWSISCTERLNRLNQVIRGWINYFLIGSMKSSLIEIDSRLRIRFRMIIWKMWKVPTKRQCGLQTLGINEDL